MGHTPPILWSVVSCAHDVESIAMLRADAVEILCELRRTMDRASRECAGDETAQVKAAAQSFGDDLDAAAALLRP